MSGPVTSWKIAPTERKAPARAFACHPASRSSNETWPINKLLVPFDSVVSTIFRTFDQATASVCTTCG